MTADDAPTPPTSLSTGDLQAFHDAFTAYLDPLCRYVFAYIHSWEVAEDLVHDLFYELWRHLNERGSVRDLRGYLYTAARHDALNYLKRQKVEARYREQERPTEMPAEVERQLASDELVATIHRALAELPARQREVILLKWERQASRDDIATALGIEPTTVAVHLRRAMAHLRKVLPQLLD